MSGSAFPSASRLLRVGAFTLGGLAVCAVVAVIAIRLLLFPALSQRAGTVSEALSRALDQRVEVGAIAGRWAGARIVVDLTDVRVAAPDGTEGAALPDIEATLSWRSLLLGRPSLKAVTLKRPRLVLRRDAEGRVYAGGHVFATMRERPPGDGGFTDIVNALDTLNVRDGTLTWIDALRDAPPLTLHAVDIAVARDGDLVTFSASTSPPAELAASLALEARIRLPAGALATASGTVRPAVRGGDVVAWKPWVELPAEVAGGRGDVAMTIELTGGRATAGSLDLALADVDARLAPDLAPLRLRSLAGKLDYGAQDVNGVRRVTARDVVVATSAPADAAPIGPLALDFNLPFDGRGETRIRVASLDLAVAESVAEALPLPKEVRRLIAEARPRGKVSSAEVRITGPLAAPERHAVDATVADLSVQRIGRFPALAGVTGTLALRPEGGSAKLESARAENVAVPGLADPVNIESLSGAATWSVSGAGTQLGFDRLAVANRDVAAVLTGNASSDAAGDWRADLTAEVPRLDGARLVRYLPGLGADAARWMRSALVRVPLSAGRVRFQGRAADFPFARPNSGVFEASARVTGGRLAYAPGWPVLEAIDANLTLAAGNLRADLSRATLSGMDVASARVDVANVLGGAPARLALDGTLRGPLAGALRFVQESPLREATDDALAGWSAEGPAEVAVRLAMLLDAPAKASREVTVDFRGNRLGTPLAGLASIEDLRGQLRIDGASLTATGLRGRALGGPFEGSLRRGADGRTVVEAAGTADFGAAAATLGMPAAMAPTGASAYRLTAAARGALESLAFESDLRGVALPLPAPLGKSADQAWPTRITLANNVVDAAVGPAITAKLRTRRAGGRTILDRGAVSIGAGAATLPQQPGLQVNVNVDALDADRLLEWQRGLAPASGGGGPPLVDARLVTRELILGDRHFRDVDVRVRPDGTERWRADVQSREIAGRITYATAGAGTLTARLQRLEIPPPIAGRTAPAAQSRSLPAVDMQADRFSMLGRNFGRLEMTGTNAGAQWRLQRLALTQPHCRLNASGAQEPGAVRAQTRSRITFDVSMSDIGRCIAEAGRPEEIAGGTATLTGELAWQGPITDIDVPTLSGSLTLAAQNGRFLQVRQGMAGTLLSVLSLRALGDIATLNIRGAFSEGFRFSEANGHATIANGVFTTDDFGMQGAAATVVISGTADLNRETQDLTVRVAPVLGTAVSAGLALVNPVLGAGAFVANRLLRSEGRGIVTFDYRITGTFSAPVVQSASR